MIPKVALFRNHPECSNQCCEGIITALAAHYSITIFTKEQCNPETLRGFDIIAFPGGIGDASSYDKFFRRKAQNTVADFVANGGRYLGICMGAYWAGSHYFDILDGVEPVQYINRDTADIRRPYGTVAPVTWRGQKQNIFFYDGCALIGDTTKFDTVATYANGDPMAIIQNRIGLIGCHPESMKSWYDEPYQYINKHWHEGSHHNLLLTFVNDLMTR